MKNSFFLLLTSSLLLSGCGKGSQTLDTSLIQPHTLSPRTLKQVNPEDNWQEHIILASTYSTFKQNKDTFSLEIVSPKGISSDVTHFQIFLDVDNNSSTGLSLGENYYAIIGADYMIEDGVLFKSTSTTKWSWTYIEKCNYATILEANNTYKIQLSTNQADFISLVESQKSNKVIHVGIEPLDIEWKDTNNFIKSTTTASTLYEDAEDGLSDAWSTISGPFAPLRKTPGYKNSSQAFVKLQNKWNDLGNDLWENEVEYHLPMNNDYQKILSVDLVGDGLKTEHYVLGVIVTTAQGKRTLQWDSFYNHEGLPAKRTVYDNGNIIMVFPAPVEMVRGYGYTDFFSSENFTVDIKESLKEFEPQNEIYSVDTFIATGGNLDNIKLLSK